jgi:hypothetical protein
MYRNNNLIAYGHFSYNGHHQTTTVVVLERLDVNDIISIKTYYNMYINGGLNGCLSSKCTSLRYLSYTGRANSIHNLDPFEGHKTSTTILVITI